MMPKTEIPTVPPKHSRFMKDYAGRDLFLVSQSRESRDAQWHWICNWKLITELDELQRQDAANAAELYWRDVAADIEYELSRVERGLPGELDARDLALRYAGRWKEFRCQKI